MQGVIARALCRNLPLMAAASVLLTGTAHAHFKLLKPASWVKEDDLGAPQKGSPCGPSGPDDVQPVPMSMAVTTVHAGETIMVEFEETIHHPGWFRIALAEDRSTLKDPTFPNPSDCRVDMKTVPTMPHDNVLVDGLGMDSNIGGSNRKFMEMVKIPDKPCDKCTLQVIQVMADQLHSPPGCIYYHCADLKILPAGAASAGSGGSAAAGAGGAAGTTTSAAGSAGVKAAAGSSAGGTTATTAAGAAGSAIAGGAATKPAVTPPAATATAAAGSGVVATNNVTTAGTSASTTATAPSAPAAQSSSSCAVRAPGRDHGAATWIGWMGVALVLTRLRRRSR